MTFLKNRAFSLIELSIVLAMMSILATAIAPVAIRSFEIKAGEKTVEEIKMIQQAAQNYYQDRGIWPDDIAGLKDGGYINALWVTDNPWHYPYQISNAEASFTVSTELPLSVSSMVASRLPSAVINTNSSNRIVTSTVLMSTGGPNIPVGSILPVTTNSIPSGWLLCNGQSVSRSTYHHLFSVIGTTFGSGDGSTTFTLPDLRGRTVVGLENMGGVAANVISSWPQAKILGGTFGEETHRLTIGEMPAHHFDLMINDATSSGGPIRYPETVNVTNLKAYSTNTLGNDQPHNVIQPSIALNWMIKA